jgi:ankyrin repeat protein
MADHYVVIERGGEISKPMERHIRKIAVSSALLILGAISSFAQVASTAGTQVSSPVAVSRKEVEDHRIGRVPILRVDFADGNSPLLSMTGIVVKVTVSPDGVVTSAWGGRYPGPYSDPENGPANIQSKAAAAVREIHYCPFERDGHSVWATFTERVSVLPPELKPSVHIPFPEVRDWKTVVMTLTRTSCLGSCPYYEITVYGDGTVVYNGTRFVAIKGRHQCTISETSVRELVTAFRDADYYSLRDKYVFDATDLPTYISSIEIDGQSKEVTDYAGETIGMPLAVSDLETTIDRLSGAKGWTEGSADAVHCLREENWNFNSPQGAQLLVGVAELGSTDAVRELVAAGAPLNGRGDLDRTPLMWAAQRGNIEMLSILLAAGAGEQDARGIGAALAIAGESKNKEAENTILTFGKSSGFRNDQGQTMLMLAAASGVLTVVDQILKDHPNVNAQDKNGRTALMAAANQDHDKAKSPEIDRAWVARILLEAGADPNIRDEDGNTALIDATQDSNVVLVLLQGGANINAQNKAGQTALIDCANPEVAWVLLANHADSSIRDADGKTALDLARQYHLQQKEEVLLSGKEPRNR